MNDQDKKDFEEWVELARSIELDIAKKNLKNGQDPETVLKELSYRLLAKFLHPLIKITESSYTVSYNPVVSRAEYQDYMTLKNIGLKADHIIKD
ncbi:MAG: hypothetical protein EBX47_09110 [Synechococcaceae bacterium WB8_1B_057]|nr:hypothetical protein [Synechococcaceae bacterium WB6_1A_059]NDG79572.1 hypothetical protein [Synechococcaceae bacterium WB8_1B_057]